MSMPSLFPDVGAQAHDARTPVRMTPDPAQDGVTHVNVYSKGQTALGQFLSNFYAKRVDVVCPDGVTRTFGSIEALWYWLAVSHHPRAEALRPLAGYAAKDLGRRLKDEVAPLTVPGFEEIICRAIRTKVLESERGRKELAACTLPFEHYYVMRGRVHDVKARYPWLIDLFGELREDCRR